MAESNEAANVPKFGSFKARQSNPKIDHQSTKDYKSRAEERTHGSDNRNSKDKRSSYVSQRSPPHRKSSVESEPFFVDVRGDPQNIQFGGMHRGDIPSYYRAGSGSIIGAPSYVKIDKKASTEQTVVFYDTAPSMKHSKVTPPKRASDDVPQVVSDSVEGPGSSLTAANTEPQEDFLRLKPASEAPSTRVGDGIWEFIEKGSELGEE